MSANVDQKRVLKFSSLEAFNAVSKTLEYPGLFMIGDTNKSDVDGTPINKSARRAAYDVISEAEFGDIVLAEVSTNKLSAIQNSDYNLEDYPLADYKPIAVCIFDKASNVNNQAVFMSVQWADHTNIGTPYKFAKRMKWGGQNITYQDFPRLAPGPKLSNVDITYSSVDVNNDVKTVIKSPNDSIAFWVCWKYKTIGTNEGEWYLPSWYDVSKYKDNFSTIHSVFVNIQSKVGKDYLGPSSAFWKFWLACCDPYSSKNAYVFIDSGDHIAYDSKEDTSNYCVRPVLIID